LADIDQALRSGTRRLRRWRIAVFAAATLLVGVVTVAALTAHHVVQTRIWQATVPGVDSGNAEAHGPGGGASGAHTDITNWVAANFTPIKVASDTIYDLTAPQTARA
jgi:hypothetical protein